MDTSMQKRLVQRLVGIQQVHVLADHLEFYGVPGVQLRIDNLFPVGKVSRTNIQAKLIYNNIIQALLVKHRRDSIDGVCVDQGNDTLGLDIGKERNLVSGIFWNLVIRPDNQDVWLQANGAEFFHRVLGWLGLGLTRRCYIRYKGQMHQQRPFRAHLKAKLPDRFKKWLGFYVTHSAADLDDGYLDTFGSS